MCKIEEHSFVRGSHLRREGFSHLEANCTPLATSSLYSSAFPSGPKIDAQSPSYPLLQYPLFAFFVMFLPLIDSVGWLEVSAIRRCGNVDVSVTEQVAEEMPIAIVINGISHAVMMATPRDLEEFAIGFALSEGIVKSACDIFDVEPLVNSYSAEVQLTIAQEDFVRLKQNRRAMSGPSGCGVCGTESIELLELFPGPIPASTRVTNVQSTAVREAGKLLPAYQRLMRLTGGVHAAAWCNLEGNIRFAFEDVGRHNALDKLIGHLGKSNLPTEGGFVFMSSRASYELVRKAAKVGIPMLATISAPTSLAIDIALRAGIRLVSFCREDRFVEYSS